MHLPCILACSSFGRFYPSDHPWQHLFTTEACAAAATNKVGGITVARLHHVFFTAVSTVLPQPRTRPAIADPCPRNPCCNIGHSPVLCRSPRTCTRLAGMHHMPYPPSGACMPAECKVHVMLSYILVVHGQGEQGALQGLWPSRPWLADQQRCFIMRMSNASTTCPAGLCLCVYGLLLKWHDQA